MPWRGRAWSWRSWSSTRPPSPPSTVFAAARSCGSRSRRTARSARSSRTRRTRTFRAACATGGGASVRCSTGRSRTVWIWARWAGMSGRLPASRGASQTKARRTIPIPSRLRARGRSWRPTRRTVLRATRRPLTTCCAVCNARCRMRRRVPRSPRICAKNTRPRWWTSSRTPIPSSTTSSGACSSIPPSVPRRRSSSWAIPSRRSTPSAAATSTPTRRP